MKKPTLDEFFSDPRYAEDANFMRAAVKKVFAEVASEEVERRKKEKKQDFSLFGGLFGGSDTEEKPEGNKDEK